MLDINYILQNIEAVKKACENKNLDSKVVDRLLRVDKKRRELIANIEKTRSLRNQLLKKIKTKPDKKTIAQGKKIKDLLLKMEPDLRAVEQEFNDLMLRIPSVPDETVPVGKNSSSNIIVKKWGDIPKFDFPVKDHIQLAKSLDLVDFDRGVKVAGFRGYYLKNEAVLLHFGVLWYTLEKLINKGFIPIIPPIIDKERCFINTGHFPWGSMDIYKTFDDEKEKEKRFLAGTAEVPLVSYHQDEVLEERNLPLKYAGFSPCFRREIGSYGKDTRGMYRIHEFMKIEQVILCANDMRESIRWHENLLRNAEEVLQDLQLPYRVMLMCTGDMGEPQIKKYDIETWMPGRESYGETMSDSIMGEFQSRRANIKYRTKNGEIKYVHMLNNTAVASPRILIAILENYQTKEGKVRVPKALQKYVGKEIIGR